MDSSEHERRFHSGIERLRSPERLARMEVERVVDLALEGIQAASVLDIGTGSGLFAEEFARRGLTVTGVDVNPEMLAAARGFVPQGTFKEGAAESLPVEDSAVDLAFMGLVLHEVDDLDQALTEMHRAVCHRAAALEWAYRTEDFGAPLEHRLPPERVITAAKKAGFSQVEVIPLQVLVLYRMKKE